ncbi:hypothetical protein [Streptomyces himastatinicus]|uniref:hypothetical protein n=1 Tax=Streptomyces himastatinicus TaxID=998084 RepID=UPI0001B4D5D2|nr:hypothetical protein [Streptomyces himastatinicus]
MTVRSAWLLPNGQTREDTRLTPVGTFAPESETRTRDGVIPGGDPFAAAGAGAMALQIGVGRALVQGTDAQGAYPVANDAPAILTFADGDAQFARIDAVVVRVYDELFDTDGQNLARIEIIQGERAETPTAPTLPSACLRLWDVTIPAGASAGVGGIDWTAALADRRRYTVAVGAVVPRGAASDVGAYDGQYADHGGVLKRWSVTAGQWQTYRPPSDVQTATGAAVVTAASGWTLHNAQAVRVSGMITVRVQIERTGPDYGPASSDGNLADLAMFTVAAGWRPNGIYGVERMPTIVTDSYGDGAGYLTPNTGLFELVSWGPGATVVKNRWHRVMITYPA